MSILGDNAFSQNKLRYYPFKKPIKGLMGVNDKPIYSTDSSFFFSPSFSIDLFIRENVSGKYKVGAIPGIGYGFKYNPYHWEKKFLFGIDLFAQANFSDEDSLHNGLDYFNIDFMPVLTIIDWIGIGYGIRFKVGLEGLKSENRGIFSIGIKKSF